MQSHLCAREALTAASEVPYPDDAGEFNQALSSCLGALTATPDPRYQVFFSPDDAPTHIPGGISSRSLRALIDEMQDAQTLSVAVQHFSALALASTLRRHGNDPSVDVRLILDDDTFYHAGESNSDWNVYESYIMDTGVDTRFVLTNHGRYQYQHNKYVVVDDRSVFCGAGNFTEAAFVDNYENFYLLRDPAVVQQYRDHHSALWPLARNATDLPATQPNVQP